MNRTRRRQVVGIIILIALAACSLWLCAIACHGLAVARIAHTRLAWARSLQSGNWRSALSPAEITSLRNDMLAAEGHLRAVRRYAAPALFVMERLGWCPYLGSSLQAVPHLLDIGIELSAAAAEVLVVGQAATQSADPLSASSLPLVLDALDAHRVHVETARRHVTSARAARARLTGQSFPAPLVRAVSILDAFLPTLDRAILGAMAAPHLLGNDRPRTYLILAQNSDELRATGGFISSVGTITLDRGRITHLDLQDSYRADDITIPHPVPPDPLIRHMRIGVLLLRDANWWPDFPTSATLIMRLWQENQGQVVDGVIAFDQKALELLLGAIGPVTVEGQADPVTAASLMSILRESWGVVPESDQEKAQWWVGRKDFFTRLARAAIDRLQGGLSLLATLRLVRALESTADGKHALMYSQEPALRPILADLGIDGAVAPTRSDYLMVVDTNMGFNKVNARIRQSISYTVNLDHTGRSQARVTILYTNTASIRLTECIHAPIYGRVYEDMMERCYWDYLRVYAPLGSTPVLGRGSPDIEVSYEGDKQTMATFFVLPPGEGRALNIDYLLPYGILQTVGQHRRYTLVVQKQAGTPSLPLSVALTLPGGARFISSTPRPKSMSGNTLHYDLTLDRDLALKVTYAP